MANKTRILRRRKPPSFGRRRAPSLRSGSSPRRITVGSLAYQITASTSNFTAGVVGTKAELRDLKSAFLASQPPVEKFSTAISHLEGLATKFPSKAAGINRTIAAMRTEMNQAAFKATAFGKAWSAITPTIDVGNLALRGGHAALAMFRKGIDSVIDRVGELREMSKKAGGMGMSLSDLVGLSEAAEDLAGVSAGEFEGKLGKFGTGIGTAAMTGKGPAADVLKRLGLDAGELSGMGVKDQLLTVADAMEKIENVNERMALSKGILGKGGEELAEMLAAGGDAIRRIADEAERTAGMKFVNTADIEVADRAMDQLSDSLEGVWNIAASELSPVITRIADGMADLASEGQNLRSTFDAIAGITQLWLIGLREISDNPAFKFMQVNVGNLLSGLGQVGNVAASIENAGRGTAIEGGTSQSGIAANVNQDAIDKAAVAQRLSTAKRLDDWQKMQDMIVKGVEDEAKLAQTAQDKLLKDRQDVMQRVIDMQGKAYIENEQSAHKIADAQLTGAEKLREDFEELIELRDKGFFDEHPEAFDKGLEDLRRKSRDMSLTDTGPRSVGALRGGSVEALRQEFSGQSNTEKQLEEQKKIEENTAQAATLLGEIKSAITANQTREAN